MTINLVVGLHVWVLDQTVTNTLTGEQHTMTKASIKRAIVTAIARDVKLQPTNDVAAELAALTAFGFVRNGGN